MGGVMWRAGHSRAGTGRTLDRQGTGGIARAWYLCQILALLMATLRQSQHKLGLLCLTHNCVEIQDTVWPWNLQVIQNPSKDEDGLQRTSWTWSEHLHIVYEKCFEAWRSCGPVSPQNQKCLSEVQGDHIQPSCTSEDHPDVASGQVWEIFWGPPE